MENNSDNSEEMNGSLYQLADDLGQLVMREHQILQSEMKQLGSLVGDAVKSLDSNFRQLNSNASEQAEILNKVLGDGCISAEHKDRFTEISRQVDLHTAATIRILQFDDIVQQLAGHACDRIARMQELFCELESMLAEIRPPKSVEQEKIENHIKLMQVEVGNFRVKLEKENPVKQESMEEGKIELF